MGSTVPNKDFIISDADFVDWLTEAMGGYAIPPFLKEYKQKKSYLFLGLDFDRDTYRMVANEITLGLDTGIVVSKKDEYTKKEHKFLKTHNLELVEQDTEEFLKRL